MNATVRLAVPGDLPTLEALYPAAFPEEDLLPVVRALWQTAGVLSLVAEVGGAVAGHVAFTSCGVAGSTARITMLAPLAVAPTQQCAGLGTALVREGLRREAEAAMALVLGDPAYYGRFGFAQEDGIAAPHPIPADWASAWQSLVLAGPVVSGQLEVPECWRDPALWSA